MEIAGEGLRKGALAPHPIPATAAMKAARPAVDRAARRLADCARSRNSGNMGRSAVVGTSGELLICSFVPLSAAAEVAEAGLDFTSTLVKISLLMAFSFSGAVRHRIRFPATGGSGASEIKVGQEGG